MPKKLNIYEFGRRLLESNDLDPVYVILNEAQLDNHELRKWLLSYWCFYDVGTASVITAKQDYWKAMKLAAGSKELPRGKERRHFRGDNSIASVNYLAKRGLQDLFAPLIGQTLVRMDYITDRVTQWVGFGPWIAFKVADMLERLDLRPIRFSESVIMYDSPRQGAKLLWVCENGVSANGEDGVERWATESILQEIGGALAPPRYERILNVQEVETILCKWKSYMSGHYHLGEDLEGTRRSLLRFAKCEMSQRLLAAGERGGLW